jgi:hypothetical protein
VVVGYSNAESLMVACLAGADFFTVTPSAVPVFIDGGDPVGTLPGNLLTLVAGARA